MTLNTAESSLEQRAAAGISPAQMEAQDRALTKILLAIQAFILIWVVVHGLWWGLVLEGVVMLAVLVTHRR